MDAIDFCSLVMVSTMTISIFIDVTIHGCEHAMAFAILSTIDTLREVIAVAKRRFPLALSIWGK